jgi:putative ABC transport system permease protein
MLLSRSFLLLIGIGIVMGMPVGYYLGNLFITNYAYRIAITPWLLLGSASIVILLGMFTIGTQTWRAASADPVKSLRYE